MSSNQGKGGGEPVDDRTLLDPLNADELKALREARERLHAAGGSTKPIGPDSGDDIGDAPTRAMMAIPSFDAAGSGDRSKHAGSHSDALKFMADPKPLAPGTKVGQASSNAATVLSGTVPAVGGNPSGANVPAGQPGQAGAPPGGFGENTLMWMAPVKAPEADINPARGAAAAAGMIPTQAPVETAGRKIMTAMIAVLGAGVIGVMAYVFIGGRAEPSVVELVTNPPKATVLIDGKETNVLSPMKATLPPGTHQIEIRLDGYRPEKFDLTVVEGAEPTRQNIELYPLSKPGLLTVSVEVKPVAANITIDGQLYPARKLVRVPNIDPNQPHKVMIEVGGYEKIEAEIPPGQLKDTYNYLLKRLEGEDDAP